MKTTTLHFSNEQLTPVLFTTHLFPRFSDQAVAADGTVTIPPDPVSLTLPEPHQVRAVRVNRNADGELFITLEE